MAGARVRVLAHYQPDHIGAVREVVAVNGSSAQFRITDATGTVHPGLWRQPWPKAAQVTFTGTHRWTTTAGTQTWTLELIDLTETPEQAHSAQVTGLRGWADALEAAVRNVEAAEDDYDDRHSARGRAAATRIGAELAQVVALRRAADEVETHPRTEPVALG